MNTPGYCAASNLGVKGAKPMDQTESLHEHTPRFLFWDDGEIQPVDASQDLPCGHAFAPGPSGVASILF